MPVWLRTAPDAPLGEDACLGVDSNLVLEVAKFARLGLVGCDMILRAARGHTNLACMDLKSQIGYKAAHLYL